MRSVNMEQGQWQLGQTKACLQNINIFYLQLFSYNFVPKPEISCSRNWYQFDQTTDATLKCHRFHLSPKIVFVDVELYPGLSTPECVHKIHLVVARRHFYQTLNCQNFSDFANLIIIFQGSSFDQLFPLEHTLENTRRNLGMGRKWA